MSLPEDLLEVREYAEAGYKPLVDYGAWRVAVLNYIDELLPENLGKMQRHNETDEVFVLLTGRCILFLADGADLYAQDLESCKVYNVKRGAWHTHTLSPDARVLIVENCSTSDKNSSDLVLDEAQRARLVELTRQLWKTPPV